MSQTPVQKLTDKQVGTYLVYRMKLNELIHLHVLFRHLHSGGCGDAIDGVDSQIVLNTIRTCAMAWFITLFDQNGVNIFDLWKVMFPHYRNRIALYQATIEPNLARLRTFRNRSAFHADPAFIRFFTPRVEMQQHTQQDTETLQRFLRLAAFLLKREHTVDPDLQSRMLGVILDTELALSCRIRRRWLIDTNIIDRSSVFGSWRR